MLMFYGTPSSYMWEDGTGTVHRIAQGEGGEQGDPLMPLLYALGQHQALVAAENRLAESEKIFASHDDVFMVTSPARVGVAYTVMQEELFRHAGIQIQGSKTKVWNRSGVYPEACDTLQLRMTRRPECGEVPVWWRCSRGSECWAHPLVTPLLSPTSLRIWPWNIRLFWMGSLPSKICSVVGLCCCTVRQHVPTISSEW